MKKSVRARRGGVCLAAIGLVMMGFGIFRGEAPVVLEKAINICMECIGIG
ncbi:MAG: thioredoxin [Lachnospiraceae bacterium]|nr:thioredoxin [Lachnospiraceae bacterium]